MNFWTEEFLQKMRQLWLDNISKIQYLVGTTWFDTTITEKKIDGNKFQIVSVINHEGDAVISGVRLLDASGMVAGQISESIKKIGTQGVLTLFEFPLFEIFE